MDNDLSFITPAGVEKEIRDDKYMTEFYDYGSSTDSQECEYDISITERLTSDGSTIITKRVIRRPAE